VRRAKRSGAAGREPGIPQKWSDLQDFCDGSQSSQIGPHLVQPFIIKAKASTPKIIAERFNISRPIP
jgi:hypothetical protein